MVVLTHQDTVLYYSLRYQFLAHENRWTAHPPHKIHQPASILAKQHISITFISVTTLRADFSTVATLNLSSTTIIDFLPQSAMVYYQPPKRSLRRQHNQTVTITSLPDELLLEIIGHLATCDVLQLRLVCSGLTPAGNTTLQQRLKRLYVHSSDLSLLTAVKICAHPIFSREIEEVVVLGSIEGPADAKNPNIISKDSALVWPGTFPKSRGHLAGASRSDTPDRIDGNALAELYRPLLDGLAGLTSLNRLSYSNSIKDPGFNQTRKDTIKSHLRSSNNTRYGWTDYCILSQLIDWMDIRHLRFSSQAGTPVTRIRLPQPSKLQNLTHVALAMFSMSHNSWRSDWTDICHDLAHQATQLESLKISIVGDKPHPHLLTARQFAGIFDGTWKNLTHLSLQLRRERTFTSARNQRPSLQYLHSKLDGFIAHHAPTLKSVRIENILFMDARGISTIVENMRELVTVLRRNKCEVTWRLNQFHHHEWCGQRSGRWKTCQPQICGLYTEYDVNGEHLSRQDLERLAEELGVVAEADNESWDFGKMVVEKDDV